MTLNLTWLLPVVAVVSALLTGQLRRYAMARRILDVPNARSSHTTPMPRGGGVAIVLTFLGALIAGWWFGAVDRSLAIALAGGGSLVAFVGFLDDRRSRPVAVRLAAHLAAAVWSLAWVGGLPPLDVAGRVVDLGLTGDILAAVGLVWLLNLYNFMDGIDGLAGVEAVLVGLGGAGLHLMNAGADHWLVPALLSMAALGFLWWNWPPARIFMGDAGSGFLGLALGVLAVRAAHVNPEWLWAWLILLAVFITDATVTLARRLVGAGRVHEAHRAHAYQHAARRTSHRTVTLAVAAINLLWLLPLAAAVAGGWVSGVTALIAAYAPLVWLAVRLDAGISGIIPSTSRHA
jgi:Fuc2NAc and GlcNAc transferase